MALALLTDLTAAAACEFTLRDSLARFWHYDFSELHAASDS